MKTTSGTVMIYRLRRRLTSATRLLALPLIGMALATSLSATKAWAPANASAHDARYQIVLN